MMMMMMKRRESTLSGSGRRLWQKKYCLLPALRGWFAGWVVFCAVALLHGDAKEAGASAAAEDEADRPANESVLGLEQAIDEALENNLGLTTQRYRTINADEEVLIEEAAFDFELFGSLGTSERRAAARSSSLDSAPVPESENRRARVGVEKRLNTGASVTVDSSINRSSSNNNPARNPDYSADTGLSLRQPLLRGAGPKVNLAPLVRARTSADRSLFEFRSEALDLIAETEIAYWNLAHARAKRELLETRLELAKTLLEENRERDELGLATRLEVLQAQSEVVNQREAIILAEQDIDDEQDALFRLLGSESFLDAMDHELHVRALPKDMGELPPLDQVVRETVRFDLEAEAQERAIEVQRINRLLAKDETKPNVDFVGDVSYLGRDQDGKTAYGGALSQDGYNWNVGVEVRFPWGHRAAKAKDRQAKRNMRREKARLQDIKQEKALVARNVWRAVRAGLQRINVTEQSLELNREAFEQERARYNSGQVAYRQVLESQRDYDQARVDNLAAIIETMRAKVELSRVDGSILERNGFTWDELDGMLVEPDFERHPLLDAR